MKNLIWKSLTLVAALCALGCADSTGDEQPSNSDTDTDADTDTDTDIDTDTDSDTDSDIDSDTDADTGSDTDSDSDTDSGAGDTKYQWHTFHGGSAEDKASSLAVDGSGNIYVTGFSDSSNWNGPDNQSPLNPHSGDADIYVLKLDPAGAYQWHTFYGGGGTGGDYANSIALDENGDIYLTGSSHDSWEGSDGQSPVHSFSDSSKSEIFVLKLSQDGEYQWHTFHGTDYSDSGVSIAVDDSGNVFVTGGSAVTWNGPHGQSPINPHSDDGFIPLSSDILVIKLDSDGVYQWHTFHGCADTDSGQSLVIGDAGSIFVSGESNATWNGPAGQSPLNTYSSGYDAENNEVDENIFILKLSPNGEYQWHTFYEGKSLVDLILYSAAGNAGNIYVTSHSAYSWIGPSGQSPLNSYSGDDDISVLKLDAGGDYQWHTFYGSFKYSCPSSAVDGDGNLFVTGGSGPWNGPNDQSPFNEYSGNGDIFALKLEPNGNYQWHTFYGGGDGDGAWSIVFDGAEHLYLTGHSSSSWNGPNGEDPLNAYTGDQYEDIFVLKLKD